MTREELLARLTKLLPAQFDKVIFNAKIPPEYLSASSAPQATRALEVLRYVEQQDRIPELARAIEKNDISPLKTIIDNPLWSVLKTLRMTARRAMSALWVGWHAATSDGQGAYFFAMLAFGLAAFFFHDSLQSQYDGHYYLQQNIQWQQDPLRAGHYPVLDGLLLPERELPEDSHGLCNLLIIKWLDAAYEAGYTTTSGPLEIPAPGGFRIRPSNYDASKPFTFATSTSDAIKRCPHLDKVDRFVTLPYFDSYGRGIIQTACYATERVPRKQDMTCFDIELPEQTILDRLIRASFAFDISVVRVQLEPPGPSTASTSPGVARPATGPLQSPQSASLAGGAQPSAVSPAQAGGAITGPAEPPQPATPIQNSYHKISPLPCSRWRYFEGHCKRLSGVEGGDVQAQIYVSGRLRSGLDTQIEALDSGSVSLSDDLFAIAVYSKWDTLAHVEYWDIAIVQPRSVLTRNYLSLLISTITLIIGVVILILSFRKKLRRQQSLLSRGLQYGIIRLDTGIIIGANDRAEEILRRRLPMLGLRSTRAESGQAFADMISNKCVLLPSHRDLLPELDVCSYDGRIRDRATNGLTSMFYAWVVHAQIWIKVTSTVILLPNDSQHVLYALDTFIEHQHQTVLATVRAGFSEQEIE